MKASSSYKQLASNNSNPSQYTPNRSGLSTISRNTLSFNLSLENTAVQNERIF